MFRACWAQPSRILASSSSHSSLHISAVIHGQSSRQHVARAIKKLNIAREEERSIEAEENKPDVILGNRQGDDAKWKKCLLARILVDTKELHSDNAKLSPTEQIIGVVNLPKQTNFGIDAAEKRLLFGALPALSATHGKDISDVKHHISPDEISNDIQKTWKPNVLKEHRKANAFAKVIDLRNANAAGIAYENRKRIIEAFSTPQNPFDPGRSEVQAALLTYKIRNLWAHLDAFRRDLGNRRGLRMLVHQRAKILKYLKKLDQARYETVLEQLALEPASVEGELVVLPRARKDQYA